MKTDKLTTQEIEAMHEANKDLMSEMSESFGWNTEDEQDLIDFYNETTKQ